MSEENKTPETENIPAPAEAPADAVPAEKDAPAAQDDAALREELEQLRDTFQTEYDKTAEEAAQPEIQALEDPTETTDADEEEETTEADETEAPEGTKKEKKKRSGKMKALIAALVVACVLIVLLGAVVVVTFILPDALKSSATAYFKGLTAKDPSEQISYYTEALNYTSQDESLASITQELHERIAVATNERDGYAAAMSYVSSNMTDEMKAAPKTKEFRSLLKVGEAIEEIAAKAPAAVTEALGDGTDFEAPDYEKLAADLGTPDAAKAEVAKALKSYAEGLVKEKAAQDKDAFEEAIRAYLTAYFTFSDLGAKGQPMLEELAIKLFDKGYAFETALVIDQYFDEDMLAAPVDEAFPAVKEELEALKGYDIDLYPIAAANAGKAEADYVAATANLADLSDRAKLSLAKMAQTIGDGIAAKNEKNLTRAAANLSSALSAEETLKLPTVTTAKEAVAVNFALGDTQTAKQLADGYITEVALAEADDAFKSLHSDLLAIFTAQEKVNDVFYPYYYNAMSSGEDMNKEEILTALDALLTEDADAYTVAYVSYYKYLAEAFTDQNFDVMKEHLDRFAADMKDNPLTYASSQVQLALSRKDYDAAVALARSVLAINVADDLSNSVLALDARRQGDAQASLDLALKGMELSGEDASCAHQAAVDYLLLGDYENAYDLAYKLYQASLTVDNCETLKVIAATYKGDDSALKEKLDAASAEVDDTYAQYGVTLSENTQAIIDGTKTPEDVFLGGTYDLR